MASPSGEKATSSRGRGSEEDDSAGLRAHEASGACVSQPAGVVADAAYDGEQPGTVLKVLSHCQVIYDGILNLDKKFDVIHAKVPWVHRFHTRPPWPSRRPLGYAYKNDKGLLARKVKFQKMKKQEPPSAPPP